MIEVVALRGALAASGLPFVALALSGWCCGSTWLGSQALHLAIPALLPLLVLAAIAPDWRLRTILLLGVLAILLPWQLARWQVPCAPAPTAISFTVASLNCFVHNQRRPELLAALVALEVDFAALQEIDNADEAMIAGRFPHRAWPHDEGLKRTVLVSRHPIRSWTVHALNGYACVEAVVETPAGAVRVLAGHLQSPRTHGQRSNQLEQFGHLAGLISATTGPLIFLADCNATPADPAWRSFCTDAGLQRPPWSWPATWPAWLGPIGLPIDHVLGRDLALGRLRTVAIPGSDHRGVIAAVQLVAQGGG